MLLQDNLEFMRKWLGVLFSVLGQPGFSPTLQIRVLRFFKNIASLSPAEAFALLENKQAVRSGSSRAYSDRRAVFCRSQMRPSQT